MLMNILMMVFAFSVKDEEDEDYEPRVDVRRILTNIPKFPDISAFGPKSIGALKLLNDWIDDDVGEWLVTHEKEEFLDEDSGIPITALDHGNPPGIPRRAAFRPGRGIRGTRIPRGNGADCARIL